MADVSSATSRIPAAGIRLSESLAASHEARAAEARSLSNHWSAEAGTARTAAVTEATALVERFSHDVSTGEAYGLGVTETETSQMQFLQSHYDKMSETSGLTKNQMALLTAEARIGGGWNFIAKVGADGSVLWRGQTVEADAWNRMRDYAESNQVLDLWSSVSEASRRYSSSSGDSETVGLEENLGANLANMQRFEERASLAFQESQNWSEQAAKVRSEAQAIDRELGQPFFAWLSDREGADGRAIGAAGAMRLASPQTPEEAEVLREYASQFIAERFPGITGPREDSVPGEAEYDAGRDAMLRTHATATDDAYENWNWEVRDIAIDAGAPLRGEARDEGFSGRVETAGEMAARQSYRESRTGAAREDIDEGRSGVESVRDRPFARHATEGIPVVGEWLSGNLFGSAGNNQVGESAAAGVVAGENAGRDSSGVTTADETTVLDVSDSASVDAGGRTEPKLPGGGPDGTDEGERRDSP